MAKVIEAIEADLPADVRREIACQARSMKEHWQANTDEVADLEQMLSLQVVKALPKFAPERGSRRTFVSRLVKNAVISLLRHHSSKKRGANRETSLEDLATDTDFDEGTHGERDAQRSFQKQQLAIDVADALETLPADLRAIAELLKTQTWAQVATDLGLTEDDAEILKGRLQQAFTHAGF